MTTILEVMSFPQMASYVTAQAIQDRLDVTSSVVDNQLYHWNGVMPLLLAGVPLNGLTPEQAALPRSQLASADGFPELDALLMTGCDLSDPSFQAKALELQAGMNAVQRLIMDAIRKIGQPQDVPDWKTFGLSERPALADIQVEVLTREVSPQFAKIFDQIRTKSLGTMAAVEAKMVELLAESAVTVGG